MALSPHFIGFNNNYNNDEPFKEFHTPKNSPHSTNKITIELVTLEYYRDCNGRR